MSLDYQWSGNRAALHTIHIIHVPVVFSSALVKPGTSLGPPGVAELVITAGSLEVACKEQIKPHCDLFRHCV